MRKDIRKLGRGVAAILAGMSLALVGLLSLAPAAKADSYQTYDLAWSGAIWGNTASATGTITLDLSTLPTNTSSYTDIISDITSLSVTVTGSGPGDGTFTEADLAPLSVLGYYTYWWTNGSTIDMEGDILAQLIAAGGDFNLYFASPGPQGNAVRTLCTDGGFYVPGSCSADEMTMTEFAPVTSTPEPSSLLLLLSGGIILAGIMALRAR